MKKLLSKISVFALAVITAFAFVSCGGDGTEQEIEKEAAYEGIGAAIESVLTDLNQISITLSGSANVTKDETAESTSEDVVEEGTYTVTAAAAVITDEGRNVQSASLSVYLSNGGEKPLQLELYVKDGYNYAYTNLFGDFASPDIACANNDCDL